MSRLGVFRRLEALYRDMAKGYELSARPLDFTCQGCLHNCCTSYFQHHTHIEWAYLHQGLATLDPDHGRAVLERARDYVDRIGPALARGETPSAMCPVNEHGLCILYTHRLMICRLHGVRHRLDGPRGRTEYPGCRRFEAAAEQGPAPPVLDRTPLYRRLAALEMEYLGPRGQGLPRVSLTLAEMLVNGPPTA